MYLRGILHGTSIYIDPAILGALKVLSGVHVQGHWNTNTQNLNMYNFTEKQIALLNALRQLLKAADACVMDPATRVVVMSSYDSIKGALVAEIGRTIIHNELNKETNG